MTGQYDKNYRQQDQREGVIQGAYPIKNAKGVSLVSSSAGEHRSQLAICMVIRLSLTHQNFRGGPQCIRTCAPPNRQRNGRIVWENPNHARKAPEHSNHMQELEDPNDAKRKKTTVLLVYSYVWDRIDKEWRARRAQKDVDLR